MVENYRIVLDSNFCLQEATSSDEKECKSAEKAKTPTKGFGSKLLNGLKRRRSGKKEKKAKCDTEDKTDDEKDTVEPDTTESADEKPAVPSSTEGVTTSEGETAPAEAPEKSTEASSGDETPAVPDAEGLSSL